MQTLEIATKLEKVGLEHADAYQIAEAINGRSGLATKEDLLKLEQALDAKIHNVEKNLEGKIYGLDKTFEGKIYEAKEEVTKKILEIEKNLEGQIHTLRAEVRAEIHNVEKTLAGKTIKENIILTLLAGIGVGILLLFLK